MPTSTFLDYTQLYELSDPLSSRFLRLSDKGYSEWLTREQVRQLVRGKLSLEIPLRLGVYQGTATADFLWSGLVLLVCASEHLVELLTENQITGWAIYPVGVYDRKGLKLAGYHGLSITGSVCQRDRSRSAIVTKPPPVPTGRSYQVYRGLYFNESQWDGSDMFWVENIAVVTERVRRLFEAEHICNVKLTPLPDVERQVILDKYGK